MTSKNLLERGAAALARGLQRRDILATDLLRACLERIDQREPQVQAWAHRDGEAALARARALDAGAIQGPLHGLPLGVKDIFDTHDMPTRHGSPIYADNRPPADAAVVALSRAAGAIVVGKTVTTEFATFQPGPTRNPHDPSRTPGGSSSGSCAAVAAGMVPLAFGTQTAASIVRPSSFCGVVGYKPSFGLLSRAGVKALGESLDTIGAIGREVEDVALLAATLSGDQRLLAPRLDGPPRIGLYSNPAWAPIAAETHAALEQAAATLSRQGATVQAATLPAGFDELAAVHTQIMAYETAVALADERLRHGEQLSEKLRAVIEQGLALSRADYALLRQRAAEAQASLAALYSQYDVLLAPSASGIAPRHEEGTGDPGHCRVWTLLGVPCVNLPFAQGPGGMPVGLQAIGAQHADARTLAAADWMLARLRG